MYDSLQQLLTDSFDRYANLELFPDMKYKEYLGKIKNRVEQIKNYASGTGNLFVISDNGRVCNLLDILAILYSGFKICLIHNSLFLDASLKKMETLGRIRKIDDKSIIAVISSTDESCPDLIASTSGTTGEPKLVQHKQSSIIENIYAIEEYLTPALGDTIYLQRNPVYLSVLVGEVLLGIMRGCRFFIPDDSLNPKKMLADINDYSISVIVSVMSYFDTLLPLLRKNADKIRSLKFLQFVGEGGRAGLIKDLSEILPEAEIIIGYGLTEAGPRVSYMSSREMEPEQYLVGKLLRNVKAYVIDDNGNKVGIGEKGKIVLSSPSLMIGYIGFEKCSEWFETSDYGWLDKDGRLYIQGRLDDIVIRNGVKVPLVTIEQGLMSSGLITGAVAFSTKKDFASRVEVCVVSDNHDSVSEEELLKWCRENLNSCLWPQKIHVLPEFYFKKNGKLDKQKIVESVS